MQVALQPFPAATRADLVVRLVEDPVRAAVARRGRRPRTRSASGCRDSVCTRRSIAVLPCTGQVPDRLAVVVDDQRPELANARVRREDVERREKHVPLGRPGSGRRDHDGRRLQVGPGDVRRPGRGRSRRGRSRPTRRQGRSEQARCECARSRGRRHAEEPAPRPALLGTEAEMSALMSRYRC